MDETEYISRKTRRKRKSYRKLKKERISCRSCRLEHATMKGLALHLADFKYLKCFNHYLADGVSKDGFVRGTAFVWQDINRWICSAVNVWGWIREVELFNNIWDADARAAEINSRKRITASEN